MNRTTGARGPDDQRRQTELKVRLRRVRCRDADRADRLRDAVRAPRSDYRRVQGKLVRLGHTIARGVLDAGPVFRRAAIVPVGRYVNDRATAAKKPYAIYSTPASAGRTRSHPYRAPPGIRT